MASLCTQSTRPRPFAFAAIFFATWIAWLLVSPGTDPRRPLPERLVIGDAGRFVVWCLIPILWITLVERRFIRSALQPVAPRSRPMIAVLAGLSLSLILLIGMRMTRGHWSMIPHDLPMAAFLSVAGSILLLAIGEEFAFRGVLLSGLVGRGWGFWTANLIVAVLFALSHWPGWLMFGGMSAIALVTATLRVFVFGLLMGGLVWIEGGLVAAILVHAFNDLLAGTLF